MRFEMLSPVLKSEKCTAKNSNKNARLKARCEILGRSTRFLCFHRFVRQFTRGTVISLIFTGFAIRDRETQWWVKRHVLEKMRLLPVEAKRLSNSYVRSGLRTNALSIRLSNTHGYFYICMYTHAISQEL